ncbi:MAG: hypothetical protein IKF41_02175 [Alphaproteobacteria bacterium]|nr:hypothetical protein [Alphaproteobacteria bacterium]
MRKILISIFVSILSACGISQKEMAMHDADFTGCERIVTSAKHLIYKCPSGMEWVWETKRQDAEVMLKAVKDIDWAVANADTEHTLVEVVLRKSENCAEKFYYRTMVKPTSGEKMYAVIGCK